MNHRRSVLLSLEQLVTRRSVAGILSRRLHQHRHLSTTMTTATTTTTAAFPARHFFPGSQRNNRKSFLSSAAAAYDHTIHHDFPSLLIGPNKQLQPTGAFAQAQAVYLDPDIDSVQQLETALVEANVGIVAHYYMDVELQGVLQAVKQRLPNRVGVADSLRMGDMAVDMASKGSPHHIFGVAGSLVSSAATTASASAITLPPATAIACLGVDFMSESVQAILQKNGLANIPVYRATHRAIGCSLAESAEGALYRAWLQRESSSGSSSATDDHQKALHVVYINTSLETKAVSSSLVPTITCTSSNVLQTLLQSSAQIGPDLKILYGPDTYMGDNLVTLLTVLTEENSGWDDARVARELHPQHTVDSLRRLRDSIVVFPSGNCVVHHMFGASVVDTVRSRYDDCFVTAHLEVPGEMFQIAMEKSLQDRGVVGSTSDILKFISRKVQDAALAESSDEKQRLRFILGTEAGMVTSIVQSVQSILETTGNGSIEAEIIFPVAQDAVMGTDDNDDSGMGVVPGVSGGEGCSTSGGCATCPFMKMNNLDALMDVLELVKEGSEEAKAKLQQHLPPDRLSGKMINGQSAAELGSEAILFMRSFMKEKKLPDELVNKILRKS